MAEDGQGLQRRLQWPLCFQASLQTPFRPARCSDPLEFPSSFVLPGASAAVCSAPLADSDATVVAGGSCCAYDVHADSVSFAWAGLVVDI